MEREIRLMYEDNAKPGDFRWGAYVTVSPRRLKEHRFEEISGYGTTPAEALTQLDEYLRNL
jgi:hypothetical protein